MEKSVFPVGNQMEQAFPLEIFRKKENTFRGIPLFSFLPELPENHCTIYFITLVPCSLVKIRDFARENGVLLHVSVSNMRLDAFMGHSCSISTSGELQGATLVNFNVFPCMRLISVWLTNMPVLDARIYRFFSQYFVV